MTGLPHRCIRWLMLLLLIAACGENDERALVPPTPTTLDVTPTATVTETRAPSPTMTASGTPTVATPTASPSPTSGVRYHLIQRSSILASPGPPGVNGPTLEEPLSGAFTASFEHLFDPPNGARFLISDFAFQSSHFTFFGSQGSLDGATVEESWCGNFNGIINDAPVNATGCGYSEAFHDFCSLQLCGGTSGEAATCEGIRTGTDRGYIVTIFAVPDGFSGDESSICRPPQGPHR